MCMKKKVSVLIFTVLSLLMIIYTVDYKTFVSVLFSINLTYFFYAVIFFIFNYIFRAIRLRHLLRYQLNELPRLFNITGLYGSMNYFLPFRIGEFSLPFLLKKYYSLPLSNGLKTLLLIKVTDFLFLLFGLFTLIILDSDLVFCIISKYYITLLIITAIICIFFIIYMKVVNQELSRITDIIKKLDFELVIYTFFIWSMLLLQFYFLIQSLLPTASFTFIILLNIFGMIMAFTPVQGFANIGNFEISWIVAALAIEESSKYNVSIAASTHVLLTILVAIILLVIIVRKLLSSFINESIK